MIHWEKNCLLTQKSLFQMIIYFEQSSNLKTGLDVDEEYEQKFRS